jgi:homoserine kinase type II
MKMYIVQHVRRSSPEDENIKFIGVFSSMSAADAAVQRLTSLPGFREFPDGFYIDDYVVDELQWKEGFLI